MMRRDGGFGDAEVSEGDPLMQQRRWTSSPQGLASPRCTAEHGARERGIRRLRWWLEKQSGGMSPVASECVIPWAFVSFFLRRKKSICKV